MIQHLTRAGWSVAPRRQMEWLAGGLPVLALLFVPVALLSHDLYEWLHPGAMADHVLHKKAAYLNAPFFFVRAAIYLGAWAFLSWFFTSRSRRQDETGDPQLTKSMQAFSGPAVPIFAVTITFAGFDWLMSLQPALVLHHLRRLRLRRRARLGAGGAGAGDHRPAEERAGQVGLHRRAPPRHRQAALRLHRLLRLHLLQPVLPHLVRQHPRGDRLLLLALGRQLEAAEPAAGPRPLRRPLPAAALAPRQAQRAGAGARRRDAARRPLRGHVLAG
jgi:hypothetical protein